jgi:hypothetical protein
VWNRLTWLRGGKNQWAPVNAIMNFRVPWITGKISGLTDEMFAFPKETILERVFFCLVNNIGGLFRK